jgi:4-amino-4-deoxy-L-arabinose transferase-like glycosyltransferase
VDRLERIGFRRGLAVAVLVAVLVRFGYVLLVVRNRALGLDAQSYRLLALGIRDGLGYVGPPDGHGIRAATATFPPVFPAYLAAASMVVGRSILALRLATAAIGVVNVALIGLLARRLAGPTVGLVAAGLAAVYLPLVTTDGSFMSEPLYLLLVLGAVHLAVTLRDRVDVARAAATGVLIGLAALTRSEALLLIPFVAVPAIVLARADLRRGLLSGAAVAIVPVLVLLPWHLRNASTFSEPVLFSGNSATAVAGTACDRHFSGSETALWTFGCLALPDPRPLPDEAALYAALRRNATDYTTSHLSSLPRVVAVRELRTWGLWAPRQQAAFEAPEGRVEGWQLAAWAMYLVVVALAIAGAVIARRRRFPLWPLAGLIAMVVVSTALTYGNQRFRVTAEPALVVLAAVALCSRGLASRDLGSRDLAPGQRPLRSG